MKSRLGFAFWLGSSLFLIVLIAAIFGPMLSPYDPYSSDLAKRFAPFVWQQGGSWDHPAGTDQLGRDYITRLLYGARISLVVGFTATAIAAVIGIALGLSAGYFGGRIEDLVLFVINIRLAMPLILIALAVVNIVGGSLQLVCFLLGLLLWDRFAVVARSATQQIRTLDYVSAARSGGLTHLSIMKQAILPNIAAPLIVVATLEVAHAIILEAALSFLGLGVPPPLPSWGLMIAEGREQVFFNPSVVVIPGFALCLLVFAINLIGDALGDGLGKRDLAENFV